MFALVAVAGLAAAGIGLAIMSEDEQPSTTTGGSQGGAKGINERIVAIALSLVGTKEVPLGSNGADGTINDWLKEVSMPTGNPWCAAFVTHCLQKAAKEAGVEAPIKGSALAKNLMAQFQAAGLWVDDDVVDSTIIPPGSIVVWDRSQDGDGPQGHTGIVQRDNGTTLTTIEGNTEWNDVRVMTREKKDPKLLGVGLLRKPEKTMLVGDSLGVGLAKPLGELLPPMVNESIGGTRTRHWHGPTIQAAIAKHSPTRIIISSGTNDIAAVNSSAVGAPSAEEEREHVRAVIETARKAKARLLWIGPPPLPFKNGSAFREMLLEETSKAGVPMFDSVSSVQVERAGDGIHMTPAGYAQWAKQIASWSNSQALADRASYETSASFAGYPGAMKAPTGIPKDTILACRGVAEADTATRRAMLDLCGETGYVVDSMAAVIACESGWKPWAVNGLRTDKNGRALRVEGKYVLSNENIERQKSGQPPFFAVGILQLTLGAGLSGFDTNEKLLAVLDWSGPEQVEKIVKPYFQKMSSAAVGVNPGKLYMLVFMPAHANKPEDAVLGDKESDKGSFSYKVWRQNQGFDYNKDGKITVYEIQTAARNAVYAAKGARVTVDGKRIEDDIYTSKPAAETFHGETKPLPQFAPGKNVGHLMRDGILSGQFEEPVFVEIPWSTPVGDFFVKVSTDATRIPVEGVGPVRFPVTYRDVVDISKAMGWVPPDASLSDAIWKAAQVKIKPVKLGLWNTDEQALQSSKDQATFLNTMKAHRIIENSAAGAGPNTILADGFKNWIVTADMGGHPEWSEQYAETYGMRDQVTGIPVQPLPPKKREFGKHPAHNWDHFDQTQLERAILRTARRADSGEPVDVLDVYAQLGIPESVLAPLRAKPVVGA